MSSLQRIESLAATLLKEIALLKAEEAPKKRATRGVPGLSAEDRKRRDKKRLAGFLPKS